MTTIELINEIKNKESERYDFELIRNNLDRNIQQEKKELKKLYKKLGTSLTIEDKEEVLKKRRQIMFSNSGVYNDDSINTEFEDTDI